MNKEAKTIQMELSLKLPVLSNEPEVKLTMYEEQVLKLMELPEREYVKAKDIAKVYGVSTEEVYLTVRDLRLKGVPIASNRAGYRIAETEKELNESLHRKQKNTMDKVDGSQNVTWQHSRIQFKSVEVTKQRIAL